MKIKYLAVFVFITLTLAGCGSVATEKASEKIEAAKPTQTAETKAEAETSKSGDTSRKAVSGSEVTGTFEMTVENDGLERTNVIKIEALGDNRLKVEFVLEHPFLLRPDKGIVNVGEAQGEIDIEGDTAIYTASTETGKCEITIKFVKPGVIKVTQEQAGEVCGFGPSVTAQGTYKKVSDAKPKFREPAPKIEGKYVYSSKHEFGEDRYIFELQPKNVATYVSEVEGGNGEDLKGTWEWNDAHKTVVVNFASSEKRGYDTYVFTLEGKNLKMTKEPNSPQGGRGFAGEIYKRQYDEK